MTPLKFPETMTPMSPGAPGRAADHEARSSPGAAGGFSILLRRLALGGPGASAGGSWPRVVATRQCLQISGPRCRAATRLARGGSQSCAPPRGLVPTLPDRAVGAGTCQCLLAFSTVHGLTPPAPNGRALFPKNSLGNELRPPNPYQMA